MPLTDPACRNAKPADKPRKLADGEGLYLLVNQSGKYWRADYRFAGKRKTLALGVYPETGLAEARKRWADARRLMRDGADPAAERKADKLAKRTAAANSFESVALEWHKMKAARWAPVTAAKALTQMKAELFPTLGHRPVSEITAPELLDVLRKIEARGIHYTAVRMRELSGQVFRYAIATGRAARNPAADLLGALTVPAVKHRPAITDRREFGVFLRDLAEFNRADPLTLLAARVALLTFVRSAELRGARWDEIDFEASEWRIPAGRMKMAKGSNQAHIVPLSAEAVAVLRQLHALTGGAGYVLPNAHGADKPMSENAIGFLLKRMGYKDRQTLHGFRASARSMLSERGWSFEALERQLDHAERSKIVAAYARSEHLEERRRLMADWGALCAALEAGDNVVPLIRAA